MFLTLDSAWKLLAIAFCGIVLSLNTLRAQSGALASLVPSANGSTSSLSALSAPRSKTYQRPSIYAKRPAAEQPPAPPVPIAPKPTAPIKPGTASELVEEPLAIDPVVNTVVEPTAEAATAAQATLDTEPAKLPEEPVNLLLSELADELARDLAQSFEPQAEPSPGTAKPAAIKPATDKNSAINPAQVKSFVVQASANGELPPPPARTSTASTNPAPTNAVTTKQILPAPTVTSRPDAIADSAPLRTPTKLPVPPPMSSAPKAPPKMPALAKPTVPGSSNVTRLHIGDQHATMRHATPIGNTGQAEVVPAIADTVLESIEFDNIALSEAMKLFAEQSGLNVITSAEAGKTLITVFLKNVTAHDALEAMVKANGLFYRIEEASGIVRIATAKEYEKDLSSFREEQTRVFTLLYPNPIAVAQVIQQVFGNRVQMNRADADIDDLVDLSRRFNRFDMVDGRSLGLGGSNNSGQGGRGGNSMSLGGRGGMGGGAGAMGGGLGAMGGGINGSQGGMGGMNGAGGNQALLAQNASRQRDHTSLSNMSAEEIQALENEVAQQGELNAETQANLLERRDATIYISTIRRNNQIIVRTGDVRSMDQIAKLILQLDVPTPTVLLEVKVLRIVLANGFNSAFEYFGAAGNASASSSDGALQPAFPGASGVARSLGAGLGIAGGVPGALSFQMVDDKFRVRMQLLESKNCVTALATPLILTANNEVSRIFVGDTLPFTVGFTPSQVLSSVSAVNGAVAATPITELRDVGQSLLITPNINADRTVTLRVIEENSERVLSGSSIPVPATSGTGVTNVNVDTVRRRTISGTIVAQDGMAVALGGLIEEQVNDARDQVPVLGNIPGLGLLFRRQASGRSRSELVVIVRPYVFNTPTESAATSEMLLGQLSTHPNSPTAAGTLNNALPCKVTRSEAESSQRAKLFQLHNRSLSAY